MLNRSMLAIAGETVGVYRYELCELDFYLFDEGDRLMEAATDEEGSPELENWEDEDFPDAGEIGFVTTVLAARGNLDCRGITHERLAQLETLLSRPGTLDHYFWHGQLRVYAPWTGLGEWFACLHGKWSRGSFPGEHLDLDRFCQDVAAVSGLDSTDVLRGNRLLYYRFLLERADRRDEVRLDTREVLGASGDSRSDFRAPSLDAEIGAYLRAIHTWVDARPGTNAVVEKRVPGAPLVSRLLTKLGRNSLPAELESLIGVDPDPQVRELLKKAAIGP